MASHGPRGAGAGEPPSKSAAPAPARAVKKYRPPTKEEMKDMIQLFHLGDDEDEYILTEDDADEIYKWLKQRPDLAVDWFYNQEKYGPLRKINDIRYQFNTSHNSILAMVFMAEDIPINHILISELCCRNPDFTLEDEDGESLLQNMKDRIEYWDEAGVEKQDFHDNYRAKYELAANPEAIKEKCDWLTTRRQGAKNVASLLLASKSGLPVPEGPLSVITGMLTGKRGSTAQQMAALKKNLYVPSEAAASSSSSSSSSSSFSSSSSAAALAPALAPAPAPAPATRRRRRRRRWYGPKKGGRMTRRRKF